MSASLNRDQFDQLVRGIADGRRKSEAEIRAAIDQGPHLPEDALRLGLVDDLAYEDELDDLVEGVGGRGNLSCSRADDYADVSWASLGVRPRSRIAVLNAVGAITFGRRRLRSDQRLRDGIGIDRRIHPADSRRPHGPRDRAARRQSRRRLHGV